MRQGECLGLTVDRVDFLRRVMHVDRQLVTVSGRPAFLTPPKTSASVRSPAASRDRCARGAPGRVPSSSATVSCSSQMQGIHPPHCVRGCMAGPPSRPRVHRRPGFHQLRHFYASLLIRHGESVKTVQARLGHASASETLDTYSHLWPDSDDRTRTAVDSVLLRTLCGLGRWSKDIIPSQMLIGGRVGR